MVLLCSHTYCQSNLKTRFLDAYIFGRLLDRSVSGRPSANDALNLPFVLAHLQVSLLDTTAVQHIHACPVHTYIHTHTVRHAHTYARTHILQTYTQYTVTTYLLQNITPVHRHSSIVSASSPTCSGAAFNVYSHLLF